MASLFSTDCEEAAPVCSIAALMLTMACVGCSPAGDPDVSLEAPDSAAEKGLAKYIEVRLDPDLSGLTANQRAMLPPLIDAARAMDEMFWAQAYGDREALLESLAGPAERRFAELNFGPWDRLSANVAFVEDAGAKPLGANFYPPDVRREELEAGGDAALRSPYTVVRRDGAGQLVARPYHEVFADPVGRAVGKLREAAMLADDPGLRNYLELRAEALASDDYRASDIAWMDMIDNTIEVIIGPIEVYEDQLLGAKASYEALILIKDREWSARLARYASLLPALQRTLPVADAYKAEEPGTDAELNAYDLVYAGGEANSGAKSIAVNLPNDEVVQLQKGTRRIQIKNGMRAKFDAILGPIAAELIAPDQRRHVTFDAFFANTMFHEVAHGLGIKNTLDGAGTVRQALAEHASWVEEGKADILGLHMLTELSGSGDLGDADLMDNYVTFFASIFRSIRFGATSAHGRANLARFNYLRDQQAFSFDADAGTYSVDFDRLREAMAGLSEKLLRLQGDGDYQATQEFWAQNGMIGAGLQAALDRLGARSIPVDIIYRQGPEVLGLD